MEYQKLFPWQMYLASSWYCEWVDNRKHQALWNANAPVAKNVIRFTQKYFVPTIRGGYVTWLVSDDIQQLWCDRYLDKEQVNSPFGRRTLYSVAVRSIGYSDALISLDNDIPEDIIHLVLLFVDFNFNLYKECVCCLQKHSML
jgi:hypothetical protein